MQPAEIRTHYLRISGHNWTELAIGTGHHTKKSVHKIFRPVL